MKEAAPLSHAVFLAALKGVFRRGIGAATLVDYADVVVSHQILGGEGERALELLQRFLQTAGMEIADGETIVRRIVVGINVQAMLESVNGLGHVAMVIPGNAQVVVAAGKVGSAGQGPFVVTYGFQQNPFMEAQVAQQ